MTRFAARHADIIGFDPMSLPDGGKAQREFGQQAFEEKVALLDAVSSEREDGGPERSILIFDVAHRVEELAGDAWMAPEVAASSPYALIGDASQVVETLLERRDRWGLTYYVFAERDSELLLPVLAALADR